MTTGIIHDQNLEKHIEKHVGCMAGFVQLFGRHQILSGKRLNATKRLPPAPAVDTTPVCREPEKPHQTKAISTPSPDRLRASSPATTMPIFECKEGTRSSWKFCKEAPRLSLDSRAIVDAKGSLYPREIRPNPVIISAHRCDDSGDRTAADGDDKRRSPSVIARLMGLEPLPQSGSEPVKNAELRRSASESRVSRDFFHYRLIESNNFQLKQPNQSNSVAVNKSSNVIRNNAGIQSTIISMDARPADPIEYSMRKAKSEAPKSWKSAQQRKSFFDSEDFFPEPKQNGSINGEVEKRLKMRGIDEPTNLETLKHILEAMQLKGLLHSKKPSDQISHRNFVYDRHFSSDESPIVIMKPSKSPRSPIHRRFVNDSPPPSFRGGVRRNLSNAGESLPSASPWRERPEIDRNVWNQARARSPMSPSRNESKTRIPSSPVRRRPLTVETQKKGNELPEQRRASPIHSPRLSPKRTGSDQTITSRSPRNRKPTAVIEPKVEDESSSVSESSVSTSSHTDTERLKTEEYRGGRSLLERCDKLLHSIMEMTATESQPSPVSVLDSSFYKDDSFYPSPVMKRSSDFKVSDQPGELEEEIWNPALSSIQLKPHDESGNRDFIYISDIIRASTYLPEDSDVFLLLEKQKYLKGKDTSNVSKLQRKLTFDTITEILNRNRQLPPWLKRPSLPQIWSEFQKIREWESAEDLFEIVCGVLRKDLAGDAINGWGDCPVELSEAVLDIERLIFKDLVGEIIRDLSVVAGNNVVMVPRRKLVF